MKPRFLHQHDRDPEEVERLVAFAIEPLHRQTGPIVLAVKVQEPSPWVSPTGVAYGPDHGTPRWAGRARYAITCRLPSEYLSGTLYGQPRVCFHASEFRASYTPPTGLTEEERIANWERHCLGFQERIAEAYAAGETHFGRWPIYVNHDWQDGLVHLAAHEAMHIAQFVNDRSISEIQCEVYAAERLTTFQNSRAR